MAEGWNAGVASWAASALEQGPIEAQPLVDVRDVFQVNQLAGARLRYQQFAQFGHVLDNLGVAASHLEQVLVVLEFFFPCLFNL